MTSPQLMADPRSLLEAMFDIVRNGTPTSEMIDRMFDTLPSPVIITRPSVQTQWPKIVYVNRHFCSLYGYSRRMLMQSTTETLSGEKTDFSRISQMREDIGADKVCRVPMITYNCAGQEQRVRIDISRFALDPSPAVDLWIALHIPQD